MTTPYRDDVAALQDRLTALLQQLEEVQKKTRQLAALQGTEAEIQGEIAILRRRLEGVSRRSLPLLESIRVASPCKADWDEMTGDDRVRFCGHCQKDVFNLSGMAREDAETLVRERGDACIRLYRRTDGTVLTSDCPVGARRVRRRKVAAVAVGGGLLAAGAALLHLRSAREHELVMGGISEVAMPVDTAVAPPPAPSADPTVDETPPAPAPTTRGTTGGRPGHMMGRPMLRPSPSD